MRIDAEWSAICLFGFAFMCAWALCSPKFRDNWFQTIGLSVASFMAVIRGLHLMSRDTSSLEAFAFYAALLVTAIGTAWKVWKFR